jgi:hypothetical protein
MARPQVAEGGDGLQIRRVAANVLNKQTEQTTGGGKDCGLDGRTKNSS